MPLDPKRVQAVFGAAVKYAAAADRAAVLDRECATDAELRRRVEALLGALDQPNSLLDQPIVGPTHQRVPQPGRARNRQGAPRAGSCQTAKDGSDKSGMGAPRSIETTNKIQDRGAPPSNETKKETVLRAFGVKRPRKETLWVALA